jgi:hypothetical protein
MGKRTPCTPNKNVRNRMDIDKMLAELRAERAKIEEMILILQRLASGRTKGRGRPPEVDDRGEAERSSER